MSLENVALTGFMGSGKSTVGWLLAQQLEWTFIDVDREIETRFSCPASSLFHDLGEVAFRLIEAEVMAESLSLTRTVVALGGAAVDLPENQKLLHSQYAGLLVFLDGDFDMLMNRCLREADSEISTYRPLLRQREKALARFTARRQWNMTNAGVRINVESRSCGEISQEIANYVKA